MCARGLNVDASFSCVNNARWRSSTTVGTAICATAYRCPGGAVGTRQSAPGEPQLLSGVRARRNLERHASGRRRARRRSRRAPLPTARAAGPCRDRGLPRGTADATAPGCRDRDRRRGRRCSPLPPLPGTRSFCPSVDALRDAHADLARHAPQQAVLVGLGHRHVELDLRSLVGLVERERAPPPRNPARASARSARGRPPRVRPAMPANRSARSMSSNENDASPNDCSPVRRRAEFVARRMPAELVVRGALLRDPSAFRTPRPLP